MASDYHIGLHSETHTKQFTEIAFLIIIMIFLLILFYRYENCSSGKLNNLQRSPTLKVVY